MNLHILFLNSLLYLFDMMQLLLKLLFLFPFSFCQLRLSLFLVTMADSHLRQLGLWFDFARDGLGGLKVDDPVFELFDVLLARIVGMSGLWSDD